MHYGAAFGFGTHGVNSFSPEAIEDMKNWKGKKVPLRGPDRKVIGEAEITEVKVEGTLVHVYFEAEAQPDYATVKDLVRVVSQVSPTSFGFKPQREDAVAQWLKRRRDRFGTYSDEWYLMDDVLDEYRARADYGVSLEADLSELPKGY